MEEKSSYADILCNWLHFVTYTFQFQNVTSVSEYAIEEEGVISMLIACCFLFYLKI